MTVVVMAVMMVAVVVMIDDYHGSGLAVDGRGAHDAERIIGMGVVNVAAAEQSGCGAGGEQCDRSEKSSHGVILVREEGCTGNGRFPVEA